MIIMTTTNNANKFEEMILMDTYNAYEGAFKYEIERIYDFVQDDYTEELDGVTLDTLAEIGNAETVKKLSFEELLSALESDRDNLVGDMEYQMHYDMEKGDTSYVISRLVQQYEAQHKTSVQAFKLHGERSSRYGAIGGNGRSGSILLSSEEEFFTFSNAEDIIISINENRELEVTTLDHDGRTTYLVSFITSKEFDKALGNEYHDDEEYRVLEATNDKLPTVFTKKALKNL